MINAIHIEDEPASIKILDLLLKNHCADLVILCGDASNISEGLKLIKKVKPALIYLDVEIEDSDAFEFLEAAKDFHFEIIFITAHSDFAVKAFRCDAVDYLLKPVERSRLADMLTRAAERLEQDDWRSIETERLKDTARIFVEAEKTEILDRIPVRKKEEIFLIPVDDVASIVADGELLHLTTAKGQKYTINYRLKDLELRLDEKKFIRLSRGALANLSMIARISPMPGGTYLVALTNGQEINSSRLQSKILRAKLLKL